MRNIYSTHIIIPENIEVTNLLPIANTLNYSINDNATNISNNNNGKGFPNSDVNYPGLSCTTSSSKVETRYECINSIPFISGHRYYLRWTVIMTANVRTDCYWPLKEPSVTDYRTAIIKNILTYNGNIVTEFSTLDKMPYFYTNHYQMNTEIFTRTDSTSGDYELRFDFDNNNVACNVNFSCPMLIDLTATYENNGLTIPGIQELNTKDYFSGTIKLESW